MLSIEQLNQEYELRRLRSDGCHHGTACQNVDACRWLTQPSCVNSKTQSSTILFARLDRKLPEYRNSKDTRTLSAKSMPITIDWAVTVSRQRTVVSSKSQESMFVSSTLLWSKKIHRDQQLLVIPMSQRIHRADSRAFQTVSLAF